MFREHAVLYVDDEEPNRIVFQAAFGEEFDLRLASSGEEALRILATEPVDVMLTDQRMPGMSGVELCAEVRQRWPHIERVLVTAYADLRAATEAINLGGVRRYIAKPWKPEEIRATLIAALDRAKLDRAVALVREQTLENERLAAVSATRAQILHDLANATSAVTYVCQSLEELCPRVGEASPHVVGEVLEEEVGQLRLAVNHLHQLHNRVRVMGSGAETRPVDVAVHSMVDTAISLARSSSDDLIPVESRVRPDLAVHVDAVDLTRVLVNLVCNARQTLVLARTSDPHIRIEADEDGEEVEIRVSDNGPGVAWELQERVFEPFFTTRQSHGGTGLGLSICRDLVLKNGGSLSLVDATREEGATFVLRVPKAREPATPGDNRRSR